MSSDVAFDVFDILHKKLDALRKAAEVTQTLEKAGVHKDTLCILASCAALLSSTDGVLEVLAHMLDEHQMISAGETAVSLLKEMWKALDFVRAIESKYGVDLNFTDVSQLDMEKLVRNCERDLELVKARRLARPQRQHDYVEMDDAEAEYCRSFSEQKLDKEEAQSPVESEEG